MPRLRNLIRVSESESESPGVVATKQESESGSESVKSQESESQSELEQRYRDSETLFVGKPRRPMPLHVKHPPWKVIFDPFMYGPQPN